jgi:hypothetical protein
MRLNKYASRSKLMDINITYGKENFKFNLYEELQIIETKKDEQIKGHTQAYAFLLMLQNKLQIKAKDLETQRKKTKAKRLMALRNTSESVKVAEINIDSDKKYLQAAYESLGAEEVLGIINACVESYTVKKELLQTLSANIRKERI